MNNTTIIKAYNNFISSKIEHFLNSFQDKKIELHLRDVASSLHLSFTEEGNDDGEGDQEFKRLFIHDSPHFDSANDNDHLIHKKVEKSNIKLFEFIKKCVQKDIESRKIKMDEGRKKEEWIEYFKQLIHKAECDDEYYQVFQERPTYDFYFNDTDNISLSNFNYTEISSLPDSNYSGNRPDFNNNGNSLSNLPDGKTFKPDYSLLLVFPCVIFLLFLVCFINCCLKKIRDRAVNTSDESFLAIVDDDDEHGAFQNVELQQQRSTRI